MDELFKKTNEFLVEFYEIFKKLEESIIPTGSGDEYDFDGELNYVFEELWEKESDYYLFGAGHQYENIRNCELKELTDNGIYFRFCKFKVYEKIYKERLSKFQEIYEDDTVRELYNFPIVKNKDQIELVTKVLNVNDYEDA